MFPWQNDEQKDYQLTKSKTKKSMARDISGDLFSQPLLHGK